jgi:hypothetical protein
MPQPLPIAMTPMGACSTGEIARRCFESHSFVEGVRSLADIPQGCMLRPAPGERRAHQRRVLADIPGHSIVVRRNVGHAHAPAEYGRVGRRHCARGGQHIRVGCCVRSCGRRVRARHEPQVGRPSVFLLLYLLLSLFRSVLFCTLEKGQASFSLKC